MGLGDLHLSSSDLSPGTVEMCSCSSFELQANDKGLAASLRVCSRFVAFSAVKSFNMQLLHL